MILRQSAFRRSPLGAFIHSPLNARGRRRPTSPTRQLENACFRLYPWGNRLVIIGTFPERVCIYDGANFEFPLQFADACASYYSPYSGPDDLTTETTDCRYARDGWDVTAYGDILVLAGHFTSVNGFTSHAGVIYLDTDNVWRDFSDGLPNLNLTMGRHVRLISHPDAPLLIQWLNRTRDSYYTTGTPGFYDRSAAENAWAAAAVTSGLFLTDNGQGNWLTGYYAGLGRFPAGTYTWLIGGIRYTAYYDRWTPGASLYNTILGGYGRPYPINTGSQWAFVNNRIDRVYYDPTHYVSVSSGYLYGSGSHWIGLPNQFMLGIRCPPTAAGQYILAASRAEATRWNLIGGTLDHYLWDSAWQTLQVVDLATWGSDLYAGGYFSSYWDGSEMHYPLGLLRSSNFGADWHAVEGVPPP